MLTEILTQLSTTAVVIAIAGWFLKTWISHQFENFHTKNAHNLALQLEAEDVLPALRRLSIRGWKHIILSNHVPELPRLTEALGLSDFLIDVYCSGRTGAEKPHPKAFETVFADHPEARAGWMIGDSWRADVRGALAVGMRSILVREKHPGAALQCDSLHDIVEIVESM